MAWDDDKTLQGANTSGTEMNAQRDYIKSVISSAGVLRDTTTLTTGGTVVGTTATQSLSNKTITASSLTSPTITTTLIPADATAKANIFDALAPTTTQGDIIYHNGTDNVRLAKGTALQVLTMNSGATAPEWATPSSGEGWTKVETLTFSGSTSQTTAGTYTSYTWVKLIYNLRRTTGTGRTSIEIKFNGSSTFYDYVTIANTTITSVGSSSSAVIGSLDDGFRSTGEVMMPRTNGENDKYITGFVRNGMRSPGAGSHIALNFAWYTGAGNAAVTSWNVITGANVTGTVEVWARV
jgi:hypothetical protein